MAAYDKTPSATPPTGMPYRSFLLRLWQEEGDPGRWQVELDSIQDGRTLRFGSIEELYAFLQKSVPTAAERVVEPAQGEAPSASGKHDAEDQAA